MKLVKLLFLVCAVAGLVACGKPDLTCDDPSPYELATEGKRVEVPSDLDNVEPYMEIPLPDASPRAVRPPGSPCLDQPPKAGI